MTHIIVDPVAQARYGRFENAPEKCIEFIRYLLASCTAAHRLILVELETGHTASLTQFAESGQLDRAAARIAEAKLSNRPA